MRQACRVEIENYINSAGTSTLHYSRPENVISKDTKEIYSDLNDYTFKKEAGAPALPQNGNTVQKFRDDNNKTKFNGLRFSRISENPTDKEYSGKATRKTHEKPENTRFLQDVQSLPKNDLHLESGGGAHVNFKTLQKAEGKWGEVPVGEGGVGRAGHVKTRPARQKAPF